MSASANQVRSVTPRGAEHVLSRALVALAVVVALGVAVVGGVRSFEAVSVQFGSVLVPLTADGMIIACTALRLAGLTAAGGYLGRCWSPTASSSARSR